MGNIFIYAKILKLVHNFNTIHNYKYTVGTEIFCLYISFRKMYYQILIVYLVPLIYMALGTQIQPSKYVQDFTEKREQLLEKEARLSLGGSLKLTPQEETANRFLMKHKSDELDKGFKDISDFLPAASFLKISKDMEKRPVFKLLQKLPKGAVLHGHDTALVSAKYIVENITYRDNLYLKFDKNEVSEMRFFKQKPEDNKWKSAKDIRRQKGKNYNNWMTKEVTLHDQYVGLSVNDVWTKFIGLFIKITPMLTYLPVWKDHFYQTLKEFYDDNVSYLEFRGTLPELYELNGTTLNEIDACGVYVEVLAKFKKEYVKHDRFFDAKFIYAPLRFVNESEFQNYMRIAQKLKEKYPDFIAGFDLVGQEDLGQPLQKFTQGLLDLKKANLDLFFHAGETKWSGSSTDKNLVDAVLLGTKRIGHGYAITKHPKVRRF